MPKHSAVEQSLLTLKDKISTLGKASDFGTVLVAAESISQELGALLESKMPNLDKKSKKKLFRGFGPFATFSARTEVAYVLGLIDKPLFDDIEILREIRNDFAHATATIHLEAPEVVALISKWGGLEPGNGRHQFFYKSIEISKRVKKLLP